jgi:hypothetical protein
MPPSVVRAGRPGGHGRLPCVVPLRLKDRRDADAGSEEPGLPCLGDRHRD